MKRTLGRDQNLRKLLEAHHPHDPTEAEHLEQMLSLLNRAEDPFARTEYVPGHFTASAFVLHPGGDAVLLIHHRKLGRWLQPGGHVDPADASILSAARREVAEETGIARLTELVPIFDLDIHRIPAHGDAPEHLHFDVRALFQADTHVTETGADVRAVRWLALDRVDAETSDESVLRAVRKLRTRTPR